MIFHQPDNSVGNHSYNAVIYAKGTDWEMHFHQNLELIYVISGKLRCNIGGREDVLAPDDFALCLSNEIHSLHPDSDTVYWVGVFSEDFVPEFAAAVKGKVGEGSRFRCGGADGALLPYLRQNLLKEGTPDFYLLSSCLYAVCGMYLEQVHLTERHRNESSIMNFILDYISGNYRSCITLKNIADALGYDYFYFSRIFYSIFGMYFNDYLNTYRFNAAVGLLLKTNLPITQVALESGFQSIRTFNDVFRRKTGSSPAEYRKQKGERRRAGKERA